jgi:hypothetical protein
MAQEFLHGADIVTVLEQVGGEAMAEGVASDALVEAGGAGGLADGSLQAAFVQMVAASDAGVRVGGELIGRESGWRLSWKRMKRWAQAMQASSAWAG